jgi:hypothetical protein
VGDKVVALGVKVPPVIEAVQVPNVVPPVIEPDNGIAVFKQVALGPDAVICTAGFTTMLLVNVLLPHSLVSVKVYV